jgi:hypothetical protein
MTTRYERCRALHWSAAILHELQVEPSIAVELAERARSIALSYPLPGVIEALNQGEATQLTPGQIQAISAMRSLLASFPSTSVHTQDFIERVLRHFPYPNEDNAGIWPGGL